MTVGTHSFLLLGPWNPKTTLQKPSLGMPTSPRANTESPTVSFPNRWLSLTTKSP